MKMTNEEIKQIPVLRPRQDSLTDQLLDLAEVGDRLGMYDAVDQIRAILFKSRKPNAD